MVPLNFDPEFQFWGTFPPKQGARKASHTIFRPTGCIALWVHSIKEFWNYKKWRPGFCSTLIVTLWICLGHVKNCPKIQGETFWSNICQECGTYGQKTWRWDCASWNFAERPIRPCPSKVFKTTFCTVAPFMVQKSPKYFHSQEPQAHITFKSSQIFKTHLSTFLLKVPLTPELWLPLFNLSPIINQKWK